MARSVTTARTAKRANDNLAYLNQTWGKNKWMLSDKFMIDRDGTPVPPRTMDSHHLFYLKGVTKSALSRDVDLKSLWEPGGVLYDAMQEEADGPHIRWHPVSTAKRAFSLCKERHGAMSETTSIAGDDDFNVFGGGDNGFDDDDEPVENDRK